MIHVFLKCISKCLFYNNKNILQNMHFGIPVYYEFIDLEWYKYSRNVLQNACLVIYQHNNNFGI